jgi:SAM-dependent methyltransferase
MATTTKDFAPIQGDYEFFMDNSSEAEADLEGYMEDVPPFPVDPASPFRMLDFGCGPGNFTARFLTRAGWPADRLGLALVEPVEDYRQLAVERLGGLARPPVEAWKELPTAEVAAFDFILSNHVCYYVTDLHARLAALIKGLKPGGIFLAAIAGCENTLVDFWFRGFALVGQPVPYNTGEDFERALVDLGARYSRKEVSYDLTFPDSEENRLRILRFLLSNHLERIPREAALGFFDPHVRGGRVEIRTGNYQFRVHPG